jgi:hypothetical protein
VVNQRSITLRDLNERPRGAIVAAFVVAVTIDYHVHAACR